MAATDCLSYLGAATGVTGAILGYVGYRQSVAVRTLDLRLELRRAVNELRSTVDGLEPLLVLADRSRTAVAGTGMHGGVGGGNMVRWRQEWVGDHERMAELAALVPSASADYAALSESEVETKTVEIHALALECTRLRDKYNATLAADDRAREQIRADVARRFV